MTLDHLALVFEGCITESMVHKKITKKAKNRTLYLNYLFFGYVERLVNDDPCNALSTCWNSH